MSRTSARPRIIGSLVAIAVLLLPLAVQVAPVNAAPKQPASGIAALRAQVARMAHAAVAETDQAATQWVETRVTVSRQHDARWAFGNVVLVAPPVEHAQPRDWLFVAEFRQGRWAVGLDGQDAFVELSARSPVVTRAEKGIFASHGAQLSTMANGDYRTGMRLPYAVGQSWHLRGGPHAYDAGTGPWSSVDLSGGDERVLAARAGVAYTPCVGLVRILHDRGYSTRYYHLVSHPWFNATSVSEGTFLGYTGVEVGCGGAASGRHVHFSLEQNGAFVNIAYHILGKWIFVNGPRQYEGYAMHGSQVAYLGGALYNYGALGFNQGIVDADGGGTLNKRSGPGTGYAVVGSVADGATVTIACSAYGTTHTGRWGATSMWNRLTDGTWVSDAFIYSGTNNPVNGWC